ncbi:hypothetical protein [Anaeroarcus burkinensis]|uniref:hypothetical protein n=1 Tax=Anaeroarcus burkinensis TaxID=82376 RepID=UPI000402AE49|nr:hypothetical protein [Anaeroarcus burkinensis]
METFKDYTLIKHEIDLISANVIEIHALEVRELPEGKELRNAVKIGRRLGELEQNVLSAFIKVTVGVFEEKVEEPAIKYVVVVKGKFMRTSAVAVDEGKFRNDVDKLAVSLLLPYARAALASLSGVMDAAIVYIPTMDVLKSMTANKDDE